MSHLNQQIGVAVAPDFGRPRGIVYAYAALVTLLWLAVGLFCSARAVDYVWTESWRHETPQPIRQIAAGHLFGSTLRGNRTLGAAALFAGGVSLYVLSPDGPEFFTQLPPFRERVTTLTVAEYDGSGAGDALWVGTDSPGIVYVFTFDPVTEKFVQRERIGFAWDQIRSLYPVDLDGWGRMDLALLTTGGRLHVYRWTPSGYREVVLGDLAKGVRDVVVGDVDGVGEEEVVVARGTNQIAAFKWQLGDAAAKSMADEDAYADGLRQVFPDLGGEEIRDLIDRGTGPRFDTAQGSLSLFWENYVWGTHEGLYIGNFVGEKEGEVAVLSSQKLIKLFGYDGSGSFGPLGSPQDWSAPTDTLTAVGDADHDGLDELIASTPEGITAWHIFPRVQMSAKLATAMTPIDGVYIAPRIGVMLLWGPWGFSYLAKEPADFVRIIYQGSIYKTKKSPVVEHGSIYLSAEDWERLTGLRLRWTGKTGRITGIRGFHFLVGEIAKSSWIYDGRLRELGVPAVVHNGTLYLPVELARMVGTAIAWDSFSRTLVVGP